MRQYRDSFETILERLHLSIRKNGLKNSKQREYILKVLYENGGHLSPEEIFTIARKNHKGASLSSIYRILAFLEKEGFVLSIEVDSSGRKYEIAGGLHHDHIICTECGEIIEFYNEALEQLQNEIVKSYEAVLVSHDMRLFVSCKQCLQKRTS
ncbi:transcriptional repressor [Helicobacter monodelphidis]|uniref:ferric iron uptake transcriptional regulator n=1 Tax=Helicobacter sp. 15-1451 TaxID=2004995 RepID=UPI000DCF399B|nr:Fur family transcriptional regulator [Helicobacter sp. 15-1451]RAX58170.1 transcriptional repressor [Helicobacter sp. 15-1451]